MSGDITFETFQFCKPHYDVEEFGSAMGRVAGLVSEQWYYIWHSGIWLSYG